LQIIGGKTVTKKSQVPAKTAVEQTSITIDLAQLDKAKAPKTYEECRAQVSQLYLGAHDVLTVTFWAIGKIVSDAVANASYGDSVVQRLAEDMRRSKSLLYDMKKLYETYPKRPQLTVMDGVGWSSVRLVNQLEDADTRKDIFEKAREEKLTTNEVKELVVLADKAANPEPEVEDPQPVVNPPEEPEDNFTEEGLRYFAKLDNTLAAFQEDLTELMSRLPEMKLLVSDDERTSEDDYEEVLSKGQDISVKARAVAEFMSLHLYGLNSADAFDEDEA
jgi:hypothetical protein